MIDHIYLFNNAGEIRKMLREGGFAIENETSMYARKMRTEKAEAQKVALIYAALSGRYKLILLRNTLLDHSGARDSKSRFQS